VIELERRLSTERVLDIFTMQPKVGSYCHSLKRQANTLLNCFLNAAMPASNEPPRPPVYPVYSVFGRGCDPLRTPSDWAGCLHAAGPYYPPDGPAARLRADVGGGSGSVWP
jgi:hypothetical protein